jgi:hypothetical protein
MQAMQKNEPHNFLSYGGYPSSAELPHAQNLCHNAPMKITAIPDSARHSARFWPIAADFLKSPASPISAASPKNVSRLSFSSSPSHLGRPGQEAQIRIANHHFLLYA